MTVLMVFIDCYWQDFMELEYLLVGLVSVVPAFVIPLFFVGKVISGYFFTLWPVLDKCTILEALYVNYYVWQISSLRHVCQKDLFVSLKLEFRMPVIIVPFVYVNWNVDYHPCLFRRLATFFLVASAEET